MRLVRHSLILCLIWKTWYKVVFLVKISQRNKLLFNVPVTNTQWLVFFQERKEDGNISLLNLIFSVCFYRCIKFLYHFLTKKASVAFFIGLEAGYTLRLSVYKWNKYHCMLRLIPKVSVENNCFLWGNRSKGMDLCMGRTFKFHT